MECDYSKAQASDTGDQAMAWGERGTAVATGKDGQACLAVQEDQWAWTRGPQMQVGISDRIDISTLPGGAEALRQQRAMAICVSARWRRVIARMTGGAS